MWKIIDDAIAVSPWMTEDRLKCAARRHNQKISNNQLLDKEEAETDKSEHQTSVLVLIYTTTVNGGIPKVYTLKNKKNLQERMDEAKLHLTRLFYSASNLEHRSANRPIISSLILSSKVYFSSTSTSNLMDFFRYSRSYNSPKPNLDFSWLTSGASSYPLLDPMSGSARVMTSSQYFTNAQSLITFPTVETYSWVMMDLALDADLNPGVDWNNESEGIYFPPAPTLIYQGFFDNIYF